MAEVLGRNARALRKGVGATLEDVATAVGTYGLAWSTGSVGSLESGRTVGVNLENLFVVAAALGDVTGQPVTLAELFAGKGAVKVDRLTVTLAKLRAWLSGEPVALTGRALSGMSETMLWITAGAIETPDWAGISHELHVRVLRDFREADRRVCKAIGVELDDGAAAMAMLWKRTFTAERDRQAGPDANAQRRGRVARQLKAELREMLP
jgi:hypothetical protein